MSNVINDKSVELVLTRIEKLAEQLGVGAGEIFSWYVKQIWIDFYLMALSAVLLIIFTIVLVVFATLEKKKEKVRYKEMDETNKKKANEETQFSEVLYIIAFIIGVVGATCVLITLFSHVPSLININYHAFNDLVGRLAIAL